jgi:Uma2 family endonuclease
MTAVLTSTTTIVTLADLFEHLGGIAPHRVRFHPAPGTATEQDVLAIHAHEKRLCELVEGVLVEKAMGFRESCLALALSEALRAFVRPRNLGLVAGPDGMMRLASGLVRIPDVAFISWQRIPGRRMPTEPIPDLAPDLVVEVLSEGNTPGEMARKRHEYFTAGVRLAWFVNLHTRTVEVYTAVDQSTVLDEAQTLDGGLVLPGFTLALRELFAELDLQGNA